MGASRSCFIASFGDAYSAYLPCHDIRKRHQRPSSASVSFVRVTMKLSSGDPVMDVCSYDFGGIGILQPFVNQLFIVVGPRMTDS